MGKQQERIIQRFRQGYSQLLRLYPKTFREHFGESMAQTFTDLLRERAREKRSLLAGALWIYCETFVGILRETLRMAMMQKKDILGVLLVVGSLLLVPLIAMQFTDEVTWSLGDFAAAGVLLTGTGLMYKWVVRNLSQKIYRAAFAMAIGSGLLLVWVNLAVGLIGSEDNLANLMYLGVFAVGLIGTFFARFQPQGMANTLFAMALAQALIAGIALLAGMHRQPLSSLAEILNVNGVFIGLFVISALLFRHAAGVKDQQVSSA